MLYYRLKATRRHCFGEAPCLRKHTRRVSFSRGVASTRVAEHGGGAMLKVRFAAVLVSGLSFSASAWADDAAQAPASPSPAPAVPLFVGNSALIPGWSLSFAPYVWAPSVSAKINMPT